MLLPAMIDTVNNVHLSYPGTYIRPDNRIMICQSWGSNWILARCKMVNCYLNNMSFGYSCHLMSETFTLVKGSETISFLLRIMNLNFVGTQTQTKVITRWHLTRTQTKGVDEMPQWETNEQTIHFVYKP